VTANPATPDELTVYWRAGCPFCLHLRTRLRLARIPYRAVDIWADPEAAAVVRGVNGGDELVPTVRIGADTFLSNPSMRELRAALDAARG
jgi:glutaredoxin-like protein